MLAAGGLAAPVRQADPFLACFANEIERRRLLGARGDAGRRPEGRLPGALGRRRAPARAGADRAGRGRPCCSAGSATSLPPGSCTRSPTAVRARGGEILEGVEVRDVRELGAEVLAVHRRRGAPFDAVVVATGALLPRLAQPVRRAPAGAGRPRLQLQRAGRADATPARCTSRRSGSPARRWASRLRVAGMMEFRRPDDPLDPRRITAIVDAVRPFLSGVDLDDRRNEWVGSRPCTPDGLPLLGPRPPRRGCSSPAATACGASRSARSPGSCWPRRCVKGEAPPELAPFDPLR